MGEAASRLGVQALLVAYPLLVLALTGSAVKAGLVGFARALPWVLLSLPAGALVDRWNRKRVMVVCDAGAALALATIPIAFWLGELSLAHLLAVAFAEGAFYVFFSIAETGALRSVVPAEQLSDAVAANNAREYAARVVGNPLGGVLFAAGRAVPFLVDAVSYLVSLVLVLATKAQFQEARTTSRRPLRRLHSEVAEGAAWLWAQPFLRAALLLVGGSNLVFAGVTLAAIVVAREQGASSALIGTMLGFLGVGGLLGALAAPWLRRRIAGRSIVVGFNWVDFAVVLGLVAAPHPIAIGALLGVLAFLGPTWNAVVHGYRISIVPDALLGRVESVDSLVAFGSASLGPLVAGFLLDWIGGDGTFLVLAGIMLALAVAATFARALDAIPSGAPARPS